MILGELIKALDSAELRGDPEVEVAGVAYDSRRVTPGALFAAVRGLAADGRRYVDQAVRAGAAAVLADGPLEADPGVPVVTVPDARAGMALAAAVLFGRPADRMVMVGITGTNGKTTTTYLLESILRASGASPGVLGTVNVRYGGTIRPASLTTPEGPDLQGHLAEMQKDGASHAIMEVASHALELSRVAGIRYDVGVFTNLTQDHLDYHRTFENYFSAKKKLFTDHLTGEHLAGGPRALVNADDEWGRRLAGELGRDTLTFSLGGEADFSAHNLRADRTGLSALVRTRGAEIEIKAPLLGDVNAYNALAAAGAALILGVGPDAVVRGLALAPQTPGRLERVGAREEFLVLIDYAHTPDALARVLRVARGLNPRRLISVFGCGGDRDRGKRPLMGEAAGRQSDLAIVTSDNPRTEDPLAIIDDILGGISGLGIARLEAGRVNGGYKAGSYMVEPDRRSAIRLACHLMEPGDVLVVAGKGHEDYQILGRERIHFDDREEAEAALETEGKF